jgi:carboxypeptidase Q
MRANGLFRFHATSRFLVVTALIVTVTTVLGSRFGVAQDRPESAAAIALDQKLINDAKEGSEIMTNLSYLSDVIGPRLTGSANLKRANDWAYDKMKGYGLTNVELEPWELPVGWERGTASAKIVEPNTGRSLTVAAMGWTPGTDGKIVGDVMIINAKNAEELKQYEGKLKNAIILRGPPATVRPVSEVVDIFGNPGPRPQRPADAEKDKAAPKDNDQAAPKEKDKSAPAEKDKAGGGFNNRQGADSMRFRREMTDFLKKEGVAVLLSDAGKPHGLLNMTGGWRGGDRVAASDPLPTLFVAHEHYAMLHRLATRPAPAVTRMEVEITNSFVPGPLAVYNTVGEIRGSEKPEEFVVVGAHIDSWDLGQGTTDNGTGTCVVLETARILAKCGITPKRTIRFCLFSGEEQGLHGSKNYVKRHEADLPKTTAAVVHDTGTGRIVGLSLMGRDALKSTMEAELASLKELGVADISTRSMGGSDHQSFEAAGVPGFMFRQDPAEYRLTHHSQSDTFDKAREPDLVQGAQTMAVIAMRLANRDEMLPRTKKDPNPPPAPPAPEKKKGDG